MCKCSQTTPHPLHMCRSHLPSPICGDVTPPSHMCRCSQPVSHMCRCLSSPSLHVQMSPPRPPSTLPPTYRCGSDSDALGKSEKGLGFRVGDWWWDGSSLVPALETCFILSFPWILQRDQIHSNTLSGDTKNHLNNIIKLLLKKQLCVPSLCVCSNEHMDRLRVTTKLHTCLAIYSEVDLFCCSLFCSSLSQSWRKCLRMAWNPTYSKPPMCCCRSLDRWGKNANSGTRSSFENCCVVLIVLFWHVPMFD